jgi:transcriptional regulator with XRE-family HTH domain
MNGVADRRETRLNLSATRTNRGLSLHEIAERTKIGTRYLEAIEAEEFGGLPGLVYSTSYIRQYARAIDYDEEAILALYNEAIREPETTDAVPERHLGSRCWHAITNALRLSPSPTVASETPLRQSLSGSSEWLLLQYAEIDRKYRIGGPTKPAQ